MSRRNILSGVLIVLGLVCTTGASSAAVVELKTGQKVEGDYLGGTASEIKLKVGNQMFVFPIQEVNRLHFIAPTAEADFASDSLKALGVLKGIQSVTKAGVNLREYSRRVNDAVIEIDSFLDKYKELNQQGMLAEVRQAMELYNLASRAWSGDVTKNWITVTDGDFEQCPALKDGSAVIYLPMFRKSVLSDLSLPVLWSCADERIGKAEALRHPK